MEVRAGDIIVETHGGGAFGKQVRVVQGAQGLSSTAAKAYHVMIVKAVGSGLLEVTHSFPKQGVKHVAKYIKDLPGHVILRPKDPDIATAISNLLYDDQYGAQRPTYNYSEKEAVLSIFPHKKSGKVPKQLSSTTFCSKLAAEVIQIAEEKVFGVQATLGKRDAAGITPGRLVELASKESYLWDVIPSDATA